jgi:hypothetical protein
MSDALNATIEEALAASRAAAGADTSTKPERKPEPTPERRPVRRTRVVEVGETFGEGDPYEAMPPSHFPDAAERLKRWRESDPATCGNCKRWQRLQNDKSARCTAHDGDRPRVGG